MSAYTEAEAKAKWCAHSRMKDGYAAPNRYKTTGILGNDHPFVGGGMECLASGCMAWRWFDSLKEDGTACHHTPSVKFPRNPEPKDRPLDERRGYCGLAGAP